MQAAAGTKKRVAAVEEEEDAAAAPGAAGEGETALTKEKKKQRVGDESLASLASVAWPRSKPRGVEEYMHGWFLETHERVFDALIRRSRPRTIVELGSWYGASTRWLAERCPEATVYAIDLWDDEFILSEQGDHYGTMGAAKLRRMLRDHPLWDTFVVNLWDLRHRVVPLRTTTTAGLARLAKLGLKPDLVYIDADHHFEPVKRDIAAVLKNFPEAIVVGDDYGHYDSVRKAVTQAAAEHARPLHVDQNHCWAFAHIDSITGRNLNPKPPSTSTFAALLDNFNKTKR